ncbi:hypothetical protein GFM14_00870 [Rhizobium leguminosarum bv. viciae]|uniref:hypothetical protein n=1 Tax=Rhizobium leguminosarum TaxID=384 RepID=UPI00103AA3E4|nr:hypothetical protein [Rhizobium leguminosarum]NKJ90177.1 hypothetical protein [Rhizobium leguminosarum bv. viciae]QIO57838.1 hypothetical protein HA463_09060 [Rhizobium leguminosarum bv. trifolii]TBZ70554.1 hypothetical protein E0H64_10055 [Rhizobium leguminosarum bv. viciae]
MVLKRSEMRGQQGHNSFNRPVKAAVGRNRNGAADSQMTAVESVPSLTAFTGLTKNAWIPRLEAIVLGRNGAAGPCHGGDFQALKQAVP